MLARAGHDLKAALETETKLKKNVPMYREQEDAFGKLNRDGFAGRLMFLDKQRERVEKEQDLKSQEYTIAGLKAAIEQSTQRIAQITSNSRQNLQNERIDAEGQHLKLQQDWCSRRCSRWRTKPEGKSSFARTAPKKEEARNRFVAGPRADPIDRGGVLQALR